MRSGSFASEEPHGHELAAGSNQMSDSSEIESEYLQSDAARALSAGLYLVSTPIGNLQDITFRAIHVLKQASLILCEDTRHSSRLLQHYQIKTPLQSYHEHNEKHRTQMAVSRIQSGEALALISDAGTPSISDPGSVIVQEAIEKGLKIFPIPGPVAFVSAAIVSGLDLSSLLYLGFLPAKSGQRLSKLQSYCLISHTMCFYVAPHSLRSTLSDMVLAFGQTRRVCIAREITKMHEEFYRGTLSESVIEFTTRDPRGEMCVVVEGFSSSSLSTEEKIASALQEMPGPSPEGNGGPVGLDDLMKRLLDSGLGTREAAKEAAKLIEGLNRKEAYAAALRLSKKKTSPRAGL